MVFGLLNGWRFLRLAESERNTARNERLDNQRAEQCLVGLELAYPAPTEALRTSFQTHHAVGTQPQGESDWSNLGAQDFKQGFLRLLLGFHG